MYIQVGSITRERVDWPVSVDDLACQAPEDGLSLNLPSPLANRLFGLKLGEALEEFPLGVFGRAGIGSYQRDAEGKKLPSRALEAE